MSAKAALGWSDPPSRPDQAMMASTLAHLSRGLRRTARRWMRLKGNTAPVVGMLLDTARDFEHMTEQLRHGTTEGDQQ